MSGDIEGERGPYISKDIVKNVLDTIEIRVEETRERARENGCKDETDEALLSFPARNSLKLRNEMT